MAKTANYYDDSNTPTPCRLCGRSKNLRKPKITETRAKSREVKGDAWEYRAITTTRKHSETNLLHKRVCGKIKALSIPHRGLVASMQVWRIA